MKSIFYSFSIFGLLLILAYVIPAPEVKVSKEDAVAEILEKLGDEPLPHKVDTQSVQGHP
jgi:hypothetical protein